MGHLLANESVGSPRPIPMTHRTLSQHFLKEHDTEYCREEADILITVKHPEMNYESAFANISATSLTRLDGRYQQ